jgi:hypothetical protein
MAEPASWYEIVGGDDLLQGDCLERCLVMLPPEPGVLQSKATTVPVVVEEYDVVVVSHSCDLLQEKLNAVLVCPIFSLDEIAAVMPAMKHARMKERMRQGHNPGYHMLAACALKGAERDIRVADFHTVYSLPVTFAKEVAAGNGKRLRLVSPYIEDFSQAFARFFMRVALPTEIPEFK